jgi:hypothetical protein
VIVTVGVIEGVKVRVEVRVCEGVEVKVRVKVDVRVIVEVMVGVRVGGGKRMAAAVFPKPLQKARKAQISRMHIPQTAMAIRFSARVFFMRIPTPLRWLRGANGRE